MEAGDSNDDNLSSKLFKLVEGDSVNTLFEENQLLLFFGKLHNTRTICTLLHTNLSGALSTIVLTMFATLLNDFNSLITFSDIPFVGRGLEIPLLPDNRLLISLGAHSYIAINHGHVSEIAGVLLLLVRQSFIYFLPCSVLFRSSMAAQFPT